MDTSEKGKIEIEDGMAAPSDHEDQQFCSKAFDPETARSKDKDEPCKDGVG